MQAAAAMRTPDRAARSSTDARQRRARAFSLATLLKLGRVSNLPTVWTNVLAGTVLAAGTVQSWRTGLVLLAMSLFYVGGMYLNDYFDRAIDARERPQRPIPARRDLRRGGGGDRLRHARPAASC